MRFLLHFLLHFFLRFFLRFFFHELHDHLELAFPIQAIYSSDLKRAWETAQIVGRALDLRPIVERALRESDVGTWTGLTWAEINERWPEEVAAMFRGEDLRRGGGESYGEMRHRLSLAVDRIVAKHPDETILLVGHGAALRMLAVHTIGGDLTTMHRIAIGGNTALSIVRHQGGRLRLVSYNDTSHLDNGTFRVARAE